MQNLNLQNMDVGLVCIAVSAILLLIIISIAFMRKDFPTFKMVLVSGSFSQLSAYLKSVEIDVNGRDEFGIT
ncbi:MAG: hypothetical protein IJ846_01980, partial [Alphaproteobacteria bacterium]|nr:hypothetical protein [Alphaproteobacteria bacterium]